MLQINYGLNQPFCSAHTPTRQVSGTPVFVNGQWVKLVNGLAVLCTAPSDFLGAEQAFEPNNKNTAGVLTTIVGIYEGTTDQYVTASNIIDRSKLVIRNGLLDLANGNGSEDTYQVAQAIGAPANGVLRFKRTAF
jgi:ribosomal protein L10